MYTFGILLVYILYTFGTLLNVYTMYTHVSKMYATQCIHMGSKCMLHNVYTWAPLMYTKCIQKYQLKCIHFVQKKYTFCITNLGKGCAQKLSILKYFNVVETFIVIHQPTCRESYFGWTNCQMNKLFDNLFVYNVNIVLLLVLCTGAASLFDLTIYLSV